MFKEESQDTVVTPEGSVITTFSPISHDTIAEIFEQEINDE